MGHGPWGKAGGACGVVVVVGVRCGRFGSGRFVNETRGERPARRSRRFKWLLAALAVLLGVPALVLLAFEAHTSWLQARTIPEYAQRLRSEPLPGPSDAVRFPEHGPFDLRFGYAHLPRFTERLQARGFIIAEQSRFSPELLRYADWGFFPPYREKTHAGLQLRDARSRIMHESRYPHRRYADFESIPPIIVESLLFIENRVLLDADRPLLNPAVDWPRFGRALLAQAGRHLGDAAHSPGASTLATQIEKYRHSPNGRTQSAAEKLRQMVSASVRAYREGAETLPARRNLVLEYLNTVPLAAALRFGEVHGLADGIWVWYGADFDRVNELLRDAPSDGERLAEQGLALRQVLSLMIAHRRPSYFLGGGRDQLAQLTESHLRLLATAGVIDARLRDAALASRVVFRDQRQDPAFRVVAADKGITMLRTRLAGMLGMSLYELDRLDLEASATLDQSLQAAVDAYLGQLTDAQYAGQAGLLGERLLSPQRLADVKYSFTLFERTPGGNRVRVQTDTTDQPFDINEGSKLELGSTAKLRVLATYLEIIAELHEAYAAESVQALRAVEVDPQDAISRWALDHLIRNENRDLAAMLESALERRYSASPAESFFTGGGVHTFRNFRSEDNGRRPTVREALQASINLPFVRLMRDLVRHTMYQVPGSTAKLLQDATDERRGAYLARFADREGKEFLRRFWRKYRGLTPAEMQSVLLDGLRPTADRLAAVFRYLDPEADVEAFAARLRERLGADTPSSARIATLYRRHAPGSFDLPDQGYLARVHPLELWLVGYRAQHPEASLAEVLAASTEERQAVYRWLFRTRVKGAQDKRIRTILEVEAFLDLHRRWAKLGFPFQHLVPSLATALGSSGDRPAALAELMGIIMNDGVRLPTVRIERMEFAADTPYATTFERAPPQRERVMRPEVAASLRSALSEVVEIGTARRLAGAFRSPSGDPVALGGKTGTGDNRLVFSGRGGTVRATVALNRTATFVFFLGPNHFGTLTAYVIGPDAASFRFTSALPVQILRSMAPILLPLLEGDAEGGG